MIEDNPKLIKYILINTSEKPCYARIGSALLTKHEASVKNRAFKINRANKQYVLEKNWK